jgi:hypothetical protein
MSETLSKVLGDADPYPALVVDPTYVGASTDINVSNANAVTVSGFVGDGDYFLLPTSSTGNLTYNDKDGNNIVAGSWAGSLARTEIDATCDNWIGWQLDKTDGLMYCCAHDTGLDKFFIASINAAGTLVNLGAGAIPATSFTSTPKWDIAGNGGATCIWREKDGVGNIFIRATAAFGLEELEINIATGAIVTDTVRVADGIAHYKTASGLYIGNFAYIAANSVISIHLSGASSAARPVYPMNKGVSGGAAGLFPMQWDGRIVFGLKSGTRSAIHACTVAEFEKWANELAGVMGVN